MTGLCVWGEITHTRQHRVIPPTWTEGAEQEERGETDGLMVPEGVGGGKAQYPAGALTGRGRREEE